MAKNKLTPKQEAFCMAYAASGIATEAYKKAGYSTRGNAWRQNAGKLLKNPHVIQGILAINEEVHSHADKIMGVEEAKEILTRIARQEAIEEYILADGASTEKKASIKDVLNAVELLMRAQGAFLDRQQVELSGAVPVVIHDDL